MRLRFWDEGDSHIGWHLIDLIDEQTETEVEQSEQSEQNQKEIGGDEWEQH